MRVAFYAPLKPPTAPVPSGDRRMARLLMAALARGGHEVELASILRSRDGRGDATRQARLGDLGARLAARLVRRWQARPAERRPAAWLTYHLYYKAPDWIGPAVADALGIPYLVAEASHAPKRAHGPWAIGHEAAAIAMRRADAILCLNPGDAVCLAPLVGDPARLVPLAPFLDVAPFAAARAARMAAKAAVASRWGLDPAQPWLVTVAMMREDAKLESYGVLGEAVARLRDRPWQLLVVGGGPARDAVEAALAPAGAARVTYAGEQPAEALPMLYAACDLYLWPAIREAYGMALLEAQAAGLPAVAGESPGVAAIVASGETGLLAPQGDAAAFADAAARLLDDGAFRARMGAAAAARAAAMHGMDAAAATLDAALSAARRRRAA